MRDTSLQRLNKAQQYTARTSLHKGLHLVGMEAEVYQRSSGPLGIVDLSAIDTSCRDKPGRDAIHRGPEITEAFLAPPARVDAILRDVQKTIWVLNDFRILQQIFCR